MNLSALILLLFCSVLVRSTDAVAIQPRFPQDGEDNLPAPNNVLGDIIEIDMDFIRMASVPLYIGMMGYLINLASQETALQESSPGLTELTETAIEAYTKPTVRSIIAPAVSTLIPFLSLPIGSVSWFAGNFIHVNQVIFQTIKASLMHLTLSNYGSGFGVSAIANTFFSRLALTFYALASQDHVRSQATE